MSVYPKVRDSVRTLVDFISEKTSQSVVTASRDGHFSLTEDELNVLSQLISDTILQSALQGWSEIEAMITDIDDTIKESS